ncbi:MAG: T9SS type A sorting domain-containing protein [Acidobacteriota bacterium]
MKTFLRLLAAVAVVFNLASAQSYYDYLRVQHPQQTWRYGTGTIEQAVLSVKPKGLTFEYGLYLTIAGKNLGFSSSDSVEIQMDFALPKGAIVNDMWLWMDDQTIMKGVLLDKWTASSIYENIVKRRKDPALLMKYSDTRYILRIYPLVGTQSRKIKITYLLPMSPLKGMMTAPVPTLIPRLSSSMPKMTVLYWPENDFPSANISDVENAFESGARMDAATQRPYFYGEIPAAKMSSEISLRAATTNGDALILKRTPPKAGSTEGFYQMLFTPASVLNISTAIKSAFLFELDETKTNSSALSYILAVKSFIRSNYTAKDSFNLIFSADQIRRVRSLGWIGGDSASVEDAFNSVTLTMLQSGSNMTGLITDGLSFVRQQGGEGVLWVIAGSDKLGQLDAANAAISTVMKANPAGIPIYVMDNLYRNYSYNYYNNRSYAGNDYFYENLAKMTRSRFTPAGRTYNTTFATLMSDMLLDARGKITSFDVLTRLENGFCANRLTNVSLSGGELPLSAPINQVGKYIGQFPFVLEVAGIYKGSTVTRKIVINDSPSLAADSTIMSDWAGRQIAAMEALPVTNTLTKSIVDLSLQYNVLSYFTAFLALEPNDTLRPCSGCRDEAKLVSVQTVKHPPIPSQDSLLFSYPNPFNGSTVLKVRLPLGVSPRESRLQIFNTLGQLVRQLDVSNLSFERFTNVTWDVADDRGRTVATGMYFAVLTTPVKTQTLKLLYVK